MARVSLGLGQQLRWNRESIVKYPKPGTRLLAHSFLCPSRVVARRSGLSRTHCHAEGLCAFSPLFSSKSTPPSHGLDRHEKSTLLLAWCQLARVTTAAAMRLAPRASSRGKEQIWCHAYTAEGAGRSELGPTRYAWLGKRWYFVLAERAFAASSATFFRDGATPDVRAVRNHVSGCRKHMVRRLL